MEEIDRLIKKESAEVYEFYKNQIPKMEPGQNRVTRTLIFIRSLFNAFLLKMTAARRIFYIVALIIFFIGYVNDAGSYLIFAFLIVNVLLAFELAEKLTLKDELGLARKIQNSLMPKDPPDIDGYEISTFYESANEVGGDYFDFLSRNGDDKIDYIVIGDISGKGMAAALYMVRVQAIIQFLVKNYDSLQEILINLKNYFSQKLRKEYFLTIQMLKLTEDRNIEICSAGHIPVLIYSSGKEEFTEINPKGIGIGLNDKGVFEKTLAVEKHKADPGDIIIIYTDGITETMNVNKIQFGLENLKSLVKDNAAKSAKEITNTVFRYLSYYRGDTASHDDSTLIVLKVK